MDRDYDLFVDIVAAGSLSAAGRALHQSPASVSKRLSGLEERLGVRLIHRTTRRLALTPQGHQLHADLLTIRAALKVAEDRITGRAQTPSGPLRITAPTSFGRMHLAPCLAAFLDAHPAVALDIDLSDGFVDLITSRYDLALRITAEVGAGLVGHRLAGNRRVLCAAPAYLARRGVPESLADLAGHDLLAAAGQLPWPLHGPEGPLTHAGTSLVRTNSSEVVREMALGGGGIALRSLWDVAPALASGDLVRVLPAYEGSREAGIFLVHPPLPSLPVTLQAFIDFVRERFADAPWEGNGG